MQISKGIWVILFFATAGGFFFSNGNEASARPNPVKPSFRESYEPSFKGFDSALRDKNSLISPEFEIPPGLEDEVAFWLRVYTLYDNERIVVFDDEHLNVVYEVIDLSDISRTARNRIVYEILSKRRVKKVLAEYRAAFGRLQKNPKKRKLNIYEERILAARKKLDHKHSFRELAGNLRTQTGQKNFVHEGLKRADVYMAKMELIFEKMGVPPALTRLSLVESSFNIGATSYAGAVGVWQFMPRSAKEYMTVDKNLGIDERLSPLKSSIAAAKLLKRNKKVLGNWALAITSYNHGFGQLRKIPAEWKKYHNLTKIYGSCSKPQYLGWASRNYYSEFLALLRADAYRGFFYGDLPSPSLKTLAYHRVKGSENALLLAKRHGVAMETFQQFNPDIRNPRVTLPKGFLYAVPRDNDDLAGLFTARMWPRGRI